MGQTLQEASRESSQQSLSNKKPKVYAGKNQIKNIKENLNKLRFNNHHKNNDSNVVRIPVRLDKSPIDVAQQHRKSKTKISSNLTLGLPYNKKGGKVQNKQRTMVFENNAYNNLNKKSTSSLEGRNNMVVTSGDKTSKHPHQGRLHLSENRKIHQF